MKRPLSIFILLIVTSLLGGCIISASPKGDVVMKTCESMVFSVCDLAQNPKLYEWTIDGNPIPGAVGNSYEYKPACTDVGVHELKVKITWDSHTWKVTVVSGCITSFSPTSDVVMKPCETNLFSIVDIAPNPKVYEWTFDGNPIPGAVGNSYEYKPTCTDVGVHELKVNICCDSHTWNVTVADCPASKDNLFARVRGGSSGWDMAVGTQPVDGSNPAHQWADLGGGQIWNGSTTYSFTFNYSASTGLETFQVGGYSMLTSHDVGFAGIGFNIVKITGKGTSGGSIDLSNLVFNGTPQSDIHIEGNWVETLLHSGSYLDNINISGNFVVHGDYYGMSERTKFQVELMSGCLAAPTRYTSSLLNYSDTGWAGWSCPTGMTAVGGGVHDNAYPMGPQGIAKPGAVIGTATYPVFPHYTFGTNETGYVAQNGGTAQSAKIYVDCIPTL